jgi:hypothetical protein
VRARLIALGVLALLLGVGAVAMAYGGAQLQFAGQRIGLGLDEGAPTPADFVRQRFLFVLAIALQSMIAPLATASLLAIAAILAVLARRWQLRRGQLRRRALAR